MDQIAFGLFRVLALIGSIRDIQNLLQAQFVVELGQEHFFVGKIAPAVDVFRVIFSFSSQ